MGEFLRKLEQGLAKDWLVGYDSRDFFQRARCLWQELEQVRQRSPNPDSFTILIAHSDPLEFLAHFLAASALPCHIVLGNPNWAEAEWQQVLQQFPPPSPLIISAFNAQLSAISLPPNPHSPLPAPRSPSFPPSPSSPLSRPPSPPLILIPTGGTSGKIRFVMHTWETLVASVQGFRQHFDVQPVNSLCVLPLYHVSGLMQFLRSLTSGGRFAIAPFKTLESGTYPEIQPEEFFLSLVPTQLQRLLSGAKISSGAVAESASELTSGKSHSAFISPHSSVSVEWLGRFKAILLGGAPAWDSLLEQARRDRLPLAPTYGMTETASQIATLKPAEFLQGMTGCGQILPHAHAIIGDTLGNSLPTGQIGRVRIRAQSLAWGYYPESWQPAKSTPHAPSLAAAPAVSETREFETDDLGYLDHQGYLHILGRSSDKIITGGENVFPAEVEAAIRATGLVQDVCVMGVNDRDWGQMVAAVYVPSRSDVNSAQMTLALASRLSRFKQPKRWLAVSQLPRNAQGKINREAVKEILSREWGIEGMGSGEAWGDGGDAKSGISSVSQSLTNNPKSKIQNSDS